MISRLRITLLVDHSAARPDLEMEHGLSFLLEADDEVLLFDAGASGAALRNAERLGLPWRRISRIVLSHGHRDHSGGLGAFLDALPDAQVFLHPRALAPRFSLAPDRPARELGMPHEVQSLLQARMDQLHWTTAPMSLGPDIGITGPIPRRHPEEARSGPFFLDPEGREPDPLEDDQALWLRLEAGLVAVLGCTHAGIANSLWTLRDCSRQETAWAVVGGLHLAAATPERMQHSLRALALGGVGCVAPVHCSGPEATFLLREALGSNMRALRTGECLTFEAPQGH